MQRLTKGKRVRRLDGKMRKTSTGKRELLPTFKQEGGGGAWDVEGAIPGHRRKAQ